jgi:adenosylhomocysteine nucleosidase
MKDAARVTLRRKVLGSRGRSQTAHPSVRVGDVVVATRVIGYDLRKETPAGIIRRGREWQAPAAATHAVGQFFTALGGDSAELHGGDATQALRVHSGPIGSGNAVIADERSATRAWLRDYNDKILAIDMEAAGFATACHDDPDGSPPPWIIIRGISDDASPRKNDGHHQTAATNAARVLRELLAYLPPPR